MKKLIIIGFIALLPFTASAQTAPVTNEQLLTIIQSLMQQILVLFEQLKQIEAKQAADSQTLGAVQSSVTALNSKPAEPVIVAPTVTLGTPYCDPNGGGEGAIVPIQITGSDWNYGLVSTDMGTGKWKFSRAAYPNGLVNTYSVTDNAGSVSIKVELGKNWADQLSVVPIIDYTFTNTLSVGNVCQ